MFSQSIISGFFSCIYLNLYKFYNLCCFFFFQAAVLSDDSGDEEFLPSMKDKQVSTDPGDLYRHSLEKADSPDVCI